MALESLNQAYIGLEKEERKEQVKELGNYIQRILQGENPFIKEKENREGDILKGLVEEVRALYTKQSQPTICIKTAGREASSSIYNQNQRKTKYSSYNYRRV